MGFTNRSSYRRRGTGALVVASITALALAGCAGAGTGDSDSLVPEADQAALKDKVPAEFTDGLTVATQANIAPLTFIDEAGDEVGFDQDLLAALSDVLGVQITVEKVPFENLILGLESGTYDFVGDTTIKQERLEKYDMLSYLTSSYSVATLASADEWEDDPTAICGASLGVVSGELIGDYVRSDIDIQCADAGLPAVSLTEYKDFASTVLAVQSENIDGMIVDTMTFGYFQSDSSGADFAFNGPTRMTLSNSGYSFLHEQEQELAVVVQEALTMLVGNGVYEDLLKKYGLTESGLAGDPELNPEATI